MDEIWLLNTGGDSTNVAGSIGSLYDTFMFLLLV